MWNAWIGHIRILLGISLNVADNWGKYKETVFNCIYNVIILEQVPNLDAVVVPIGGGGMLSGICIALKSLKPDIKIYAAEPLNANDCAKSFAARERIPLPGKFW